jgi:hypothetical protein
MQRIMKLTASVGILFAATACVVDTAPEEDANEADDVAEVAQELAGDTVNTCSSSLTPSGWVDVQWWNTSSCGNTFVPNAKQMKQLTGYPIGTQVVACSSTYPPNGWSSTSSYFSVGCRESKYNFFPNTWTLVRSY